MEVTQNTEDPIRVHDDLDWVSKQAVSPGEDNVPAYTIRGPRNYTVGIEAETPIAPEFRTADGSPVDTSAQIVVQKADVQGNALGNAIVFETNMDAFDYAEMRSDPEYFKYTQKPVLLKEREFLFVYLRLPQGADDFDPAKSRITIGDNVTQTGKPAYIRHMRDMSEEEKKLVEQS